MSWLDNAREHERDLAKMRALQPFGTPRGKQARQMLHLWYELMHAKSVGMVSKDIERYLSQFEEVTGIRLVATLAGNTATDLEMIFERGELVDVVPKHPPPSGCYLLALPPEVKPL